MAFKKGFDPNRSLGGRPKRTQMGTDLPGDARKLTGLAMKRITEILNDPQAKHDDIIKAAKLVFDRGYGRAPLTINHNTTVQHELQVNFDVASLPLEARKAILAAQRAATIDGEIIEPLSEPVLIAAPEAGDGEA